MMICDEKKILRDGVFEKDNNFRGTYKTGEMIYQLLFTF